MGRARGLREPHGILGSAPARLAQPQSTRLMPQQRE